MLIVQRRVNPVVVSGQRTPRACENLVVVNGIDIPHTGLTMESYATEIGCGSAMSSAELIGVMIHIHRHIGRRLVVAPI